MEQSLERVRSHLPHPPIARPDVIPSAHHSPRDITIREAQRILLRYGHSGLSVVNAEDTLVGDHFPTGSGPGPAPRL
jgi:tRNA nucleotidyltransferase (CCA-adding enzyme)